MENRAAKLLWDVVDHCSIAIELLEGLSIDEYLADQVAQLASDRAIEIAGEALSQLRKVDNDRAQRVRYLNEIVGLRNILAHNYAETDPARM